MNSRTILRSGVIAAGALAATVVAASAAQAHGGQSGGTDHRNLGMQRMHELHMQGNPGMQRMHELHMQDRDGMHSGGLDGHAPARPVALAAHVAERSNPAG